MSNSADVLLKVGTDCPSQAHEFTPGFFVGSVLLIFLLFVLSYCVLWRSGFHVVMSVTISTWKRCSVRRCLQLFVGDPCLVSLFVLYLLGLDGVQRLLCCVLGFVFRRLLCPMLPVSLVCLFVIATWSYSLTFILTVNRHEHYICIGQYTPTEAWLIIDL
jgi:hypothetical protein